MKSLKKIAGYASKKFQPTGFSFTANPAIIPSKAKKAPLPYGLPRKLKKKAIPSYKDKGYRPATGSGTAY